MDYDFVVFIFWLRLYIIYYHIDCWNFNEYRFI